MLFPDYERTVIYGVDMPFRRPGILVLREGVAVLDFERVEDPVLALNLNRAPVDVVERTHVIQAPGVVLVVVCQEYGVKMPNSRCKHL